MTGVYRCSPGVVEDIQHLTDLDFADDLALITELVEDAEALLQSLERAAALIGLYCNESKTEYINTTESSHNLKSLSGGTVRRVQDFKYLGAWIMDSEKDFQVCKSLAWVACNKIEKLWHSNLPNEYSPPVPVSSRTSASLRCRDLEPNTNNSKKTGRDKQVSMRLEQEKLRRLLEQFSIKKKSMGTIFDT